MFALPPPSPTSVDKLLQAWPDTLALSALDSDGKAVFYAIGGFLDAIYRSGFFAPFDWQYVFSEADLDDVSKLEHAGLGELRALLVANVRKDRFCAGHLQQLLRDGYLEKAFGRLLELRKSM
ncbi:DUF6508 domain-containing protein [Pseudomonas sp. PS01301]|uniref:DUF6508 domain-containing protein n=1 Tax=Pseudomonas sp. PS01301 TaxID=2991437 RepID=UPI00249CA638|nr:DUF6508 domain-containing protein [Pseudomonas sp. PS01301]